MRWSFVLSTAAPVREDGAGWSVLQARCGSSGMGAAGVEDGNPRLSVAELLNYSCPPHPASVPLCSASIETSTAV